MNPTKIMAVAIIGSCLLFNEIAAEEDHFRHIMFRESPYAPYRGIHPIDADTSSNVQHYEFSYDKSNRLIRISQKFGDDLVPAFGTWDSFIWFAAEVRITYQDNKELHSYYNIEGQRTAAHGNVWEAVYELNEAGQRVALSFYGKNNDPVASEWNIHRYEWRPSDDGHVFEKRFNLKGEQEQLRPELAFHEVKLEYDQDGKLMFMRNYGLNHELINNPSGAAIDRITYDLAGNFIRWQVYDKDSMAVEGNRPMVHMGEHLYDVYGNKIGMRGFDRSGNRIPFSWGAMMHRTWYDDRGIRQSYQLTNSEDDFDVHIIYDYSEDLSHQVSLKSVDQKGALKNDPRLRGAAEVRYELNEEGQPSPKFFKADGTPLEQATD